MWFIKIIIKIILSRLSINYSLWRKIGIFRNGRMNELEYSRKIFFGHLNDMREIRDIKNPTILEIGPGDGISTAIYASELNSTKVYLIDVDDYADKDIKKYIRIIETIDKKNKKDISKINSIAEILKKFNAHYLTNGIESLKTIKDESIDYLFSHSVLEHIKLSEFESFIKEIHRIMKPKGLISHNINFKDHLGESLNNYRFSEKIWESNLFANSGFYTNRIPARKMHNSFKEVGFNLLWENFSAWPNLPIDRKLIHKDFDHFSDNDLINCTSAFIAEKKIN